MPKDRNILIFENPFTLSNYLLKKWFEISQESIEKNDRFTAAFSGGKTPVEFYCKLSGAKDYDLWQKTHIFLTDERFVDKDDEDSNLGMINNSFLNYVHIPNGNIHPIHTETSDVAISAECYEEDLIDFFELKIGEFPCFDFMLLGVGEDGHVASLFSGENQAEDNARLAVSTSSDKLKHKRISLSFPVINNARNIIFIATGDKKSDILKQILQEAKEYPARKVMPNNGDILFLLDKEAASKLPYLSSYTHRDEAIYIKY